MAFDADLADAKTKLEKAIASLQHDFKHVRTGRATVGQIEHVQVEAYGSMMPIAQVASLTVPEPTQILVKPWDKGLTKAVEKALADANLGMMPQSDGTVIRLNVPPLSTERRTQLAAQAKEIAEKCKVSMRNIRRDGIKTVETKGKTEKAPEDQIKKTTEKISEMLKSYEARTEQLLKEKTDDIMKF